MDQSIILTIGAIQFQEFLLIKVLKLLAQFVTKKNEQGLYIWENNLSCGFSANKNSSLNNLKYMERWCKWSAWQESLFIAYSQTLERPHWTRIMKYFCFSLFQETFCLRVCSTWNPSSLMDCRCGRLWKERAKSLASAQFVSGPAAQILSRNKIFSERLHSYALWNSGTKTKTQTNQQNKKDLKSIYFKNIYPFPYPSAVQFLFYFP